MSITLEEVQVINYFQDLSKIPTESFLLSQVLPSPMVPVWCETGDRQKRNIFWQKALGKIKYMSLLNQTHSNFSQLTIPQTWDQGILQQSLLPLQSFPSALPFWKKRMLRRRKGNDTGGLPVGQQQRTLEGVDREVCPLWATLRIPEQGTGFESIRFNSDLFKNKLDNHKQLNCTLKNLNNEFVLQQKEKWRPVLQPCFGR